MLRIVTWLLLNALFFHEVMCQGCGENITLTSSEGRLTSPNYDSSEEYEHNTDCSWIIKAEENRAIKFKIVDLNIENHLSCSYDYLKVFDGDILLGKFCGYIIPPSLTANSGEMYVVFHTDDSFFFRGFDALYTQIDVNSEVCGAIETRPFGVFSPPDLDGDGLYDPNLMCHWKLQQPGNSSKTIRMQIHTVNIQYTIGCLSDYLQIDEGKFCSQKDVMEDRRQKEMLVKFRSDGSVNGPLFVAYFHIYDTNRPCGATYSKLFSTGKLFAPDFDMDGLYDSGLYCVWAVTAPERHVVELEFEAFEVEKGVCNFDVVQIFDGEFASMNSIAILCGNELPPKITTATNTMYVLFVSDDTNNYVGFHAEYRHKEVLYPMCGFNVTLTDLEDRFTSPNYDFGRYGYDTTCSWIIKAQNNKLIQLQVHDLLMQNHLTCAYDYLQVFDGDVLLGKFCGYITPPILKASGSNMYVSFHSDGKMNYKGFAASYIQINAKDQICESVESRPVGNIFSSDTGGYGFNDHNINCTWIIQPRNGETKSIQFYITDMDIEWSQDCVRDYLMIELYYRRTFYCGKVKPSLIKALSVLQIHFHSDETTNGTGFSAIYVITDEDEHCGGIHITPDGNFSSVDRDGNNLYDSELYCTWVIVAPEGNKIQLRFLAFDIQEDDCSRDFIQIFDGEFTSMASVAILCGKGLRPNIKTSTNIVYVVFVTNKKNNYKGFSATYYMTGHNSGGKHHFADMTQYRVCCCCLIMKCLISAGLSLGYSK